MVHVPFSSRWNPRALALACLTLACGGTGGRPTAAGDDPNKPGLAFLEVPAAITLSKRFELRVRLNDDKGVHDSGDSQTKVTIAASGSGTLSGTRTRRATQGLVVFDDLVYDRWEAITFTVTSSGWADASTRSPVPVRPVMRFLKMPPVHVATGDPVGPFTIELVDGHGRVVPSEQPVTLQSAQAVEAAGGVGRKFLTGQVTYEQITLRAPGSSTLVWRSPGLGDLIHGLTVHDAQNVESLWLPAARVGVPYAARLPGGASDYSLLKGTLPAGLKLAAGNGEIFGVPTAAGAGQIQIVAQRSRPPNLRWRVDLAVFPAVERPSGSLADLNVAGPFPIESRDEVVPVPSRNTSTRVRIFFPRLDGTAANGSFPLVVFHHGAIPFAPVLRTVFDRFDHLLQRWASHGFVVATIDAADLVWRDGRVTGPTLANMNAMSENQRATIAFLRTRNGDPGFPLAGRLAVDRVIVAGHSRGGGASLITANIEPSVVGGILLKPVDPMTTVGGERIWNIPLPSKPFLLVVAGTDGDLPYPMVDFLYERRGAAMIAPTIVGSIHSFTCDASCPPDSARPGVGREDDWAVTNAYAVAFLRYAGQGDLAAASMLFGPAGLSPRLSPLGAVVQSDRGGSSLLIDDYQQDTAGRNRLGLLNSDHQMSLSADEPSLLSAVWLLPELYGAFRSLYQRPEVLAWSNAHRLAWATDGASYALALGGVDVRARAAFVLRARTADSPLDVAQLTFRFTDGEGNVALVPAREHTGENGIGARFSTIIVPISTIAAGGIDLGQLETVELVLDGAGTVFVDDLRFE